MRMPGRKEHTDTDHEHTGADAHEARHVDGRYTDDRRTEGRYADDRGADGRHTEPRESTRDHGAYVAHDGPDWARDKFGGVNLGACIFGWLVALGLAALLMGIVAAVAAAVGDSTDFTQTDAERSAGTVGLVSGLVLLAVLLIGYYAGGYVAGRMSRFDGGRQGMGVWLVGLLITLAAVALGWIAGDRYNIFDQVDLPRIPVPTEDLTWGSVLIGIAIVLGTLLAAVAGGKVGRHYHDRVDRLAERTAADRTVVDRRHES